MKPSVSQYNLENRIAERGSNILFVSSCVEKQNRKWWEAKNLKANFYTLSTKKNSLIKVSWENQNSIETFVESIYSIRIW